MELSYCFYVLFLCFVAANDEKENEDEIKRRRLIEHLTKTRTEILDDYQLVTRQIATDVFMFRSYRTVSVLVYPVKADVTEARFTFQSEELHLNNIGMYFKLQKTNINLIVYDISLFNYGLLTIKAELVIILHEII